MAALIALLIIGSLAAGSAPAATPAARLVLIEDPAPGTLTRLLSEDVMVVRNGVDYLVAVVEPGQLETTDFGPAWELLDSHIGGKTYYSVFVPRGLDPPGPWVSSPQGPDVPIHVLSSRRGHVVVEASPEAAASLSGLGYEVARIPMRPVRPPRDHPPPVRVPETPDPLIKEMVDGVSRPEIETMVQRLQDFGTRFAAQDSCGAAAAWLKARFESFGLDVHYHQWVPYYHPNVVAELEGTTAPDSIILIGGHYDSTAPYLDDCPGADDNASGTAGVVECARVLTTNRYHYTIRFVSFCAEELGLLGSEAYATEAAARGDNIVAMINIDMIGYTAPSDVLDLSLVDNNTSSWLRQTTVDAGALYVPNLPLGHGELRSGTSDHQSFWDQGYDAIFFFEDLGLRSPFIHSSNDIVGLSFIAPGLARRSTQLAVALAATIARPIPNTGGGPPELPPGRVFLEQNAPNPMHPSTSIRVVITDPGAKATLRVYDVSGRRIATLLNGEFVLKERVVDWYGNNDDGDPVASGVYFYRLDAAGRTITRKLVLVR